MTYFTEEKGEETDITPFVLGVVIIVVLLIAGALGLLFFMRKRRKDHEEAPNEGVQDTTSPNLQSDPQPTPVDMEIQPQPMEASQELYGGKMDMGSVPQTDQSIAGTVQDPGSSTPDNSIIPPSSPEM